MSIRGNGKGVATARQAPRGRTVAAALMMTSAMAVGAAWPMAAQAQASQRDFSIPAQSLTEALLIFGRQSGVQVTADATLTTGRSSTAVAGALAPAQALSQLLSGTGLTFRFIGAKAIRIERAPEVDAGSVRLGAVRVEGSGAGGAGGFASAVASTDMTATENSRSYAPIGAHVGKTAQTLREIPQSVTVITSQRLEDQSLRTLDDVLNQMTGVTREQGWRSSTYTSRGLALDNIRYDGGASSSTYFSSRTEDAALFDNVTLLRGADGLYGAGEAGGVINLTYKRPLAETQIKGMLSAGSWNNFRGEFDITGPIAANGAIRGRLVAVAQDQDYFVDYDKRRRLLIYGALEADLSPNTTLFVMASRQEDDNDGFRNSLPRYSDGTDIGLPRNTSTASPWSFQDQDNTVFMGRLDQKIGTRWAARVTLRHTRNADRMHSAELENPVDPETLAGPYWYIWPHHIRAHETSMDVNLSGSFSLLGQEHDLTVGMDYVDYHQLYGYEPGGMGGQDDNNIFNPTYPAYVPWPEGNFPPVATDRDKISLYGSLRIRPAARLSLIAGGRLSLRDRTVIDDQRGYSWSMSATKKEDTRLIPYFGFIYDVGALSVYGSMTEIFQSQSNQLSGPLPGTPLAPVKGRNYELGVKTDLVEGRLTGSLAFYRVEKKGASAADPAYPGMAWNANCCYIRDGFLRSQGFELELNGELLPRFQVAMGYTFNDNVNKRTTDTRFSTKTPKHLLKLWTDYRFGGRLDGFNLGLGVLAQSKHYQSGSVRIKVPGTVDQYGPWLDYQFTEKSYAIVSMAAGYKVGENYSLSLNLNNIFDKTYYSTIGGTGYGNFYGDPRNFLVTARIKL